VLAVACWSSDDWGPVLSSADVGLPHAGGRSLLGFWLVRQPRWLHVSPQVCRDAQAFIDSKKANGRRAGALSSIIHEAMHSIGIPDEAKANCYAVQLVPVFVKNLGMSAHDSRNLGRLALLYVRRHAPPGYWDHYHCRDLGGWDLAPDANNLSS
jgi:hypothetical protein